MDPIATALAALTLLGLLEGLAALTATLFSTLSLAIFPSLDAGWLVFALVPLVALIAPALPLGRWLERHTIIVVGAAVAAVARVGLAFPSPVVRGVAAVLVVAGGALFIAGAIGAIDRRAIAGGASAAIVLDQLLRFAGWSWDPMLRPAGAFAHVIIGAATLLLLRRWHADPEEDEQGNPLERRAGALRLRGGAGFACLLFLELNVLRPEVIARWSGVSYRFLAATLIASGALATLLLLAGRGPAGRHRPAAIALTATIGAAILVPRLGHAPALLVFTLAALGQASALLLLSRVLVPATARRSSWTVSASLAGVVLLTAAYTLTFFHAFTLPALAGKAPALLFGTVLALACVLLLIPRPLAAEPTLGWWPGLGIVAAVCAIAVAGALRRPAPAAPTAQDARAPVVATWNIHYGYAEDWRFDPETLARTIEASGADVIALQEVAAGLLAMYGADLPAWLGRRLGMRAFFAPSIDGQLGEAVLTRLPASNFESIVIPPAVGDAKRLAKVVVDAGGVQVRIFGVHFGLSETERADQIAAVLSAIGDGPAVLAGDLNAEANSDVADALVRAGFADGFDAAGATPAPTWPAGEPEVRIDWIWLRGYEATEAVVRAERGSDHRLVSARLAIPRS